MDRISPITNSLFQPVMVSFKQNKNQRFCIFFTGTLQMCFLFLGMSSTLSKLFFYLDLKTWIQYPNQFLHREIEALDKLHFSITVHLYVLVVIDDVDLRPFPPRMLQTRRKRNDISKPQLNLYQQLQLIHVLLLYSMRLLNALFVITRLKIYGIYVAIRLNI